MVSFLHVKTWSVSIKRQPEPVYEFISNPRNLPHWAPSFCQSVRHSEGGWIVAPEKDQ